MDQVNVSRIKISVLIGCPSFYKYLYANFHDHCLPEMFFKLLFFHSDDELTSYHNISRVSELTHSINILLEMSCTLVIISSISLIILY